MELKTIEEFNKAIKTNNDNDIVVFKFSPICPISRRIENEFDSWFKKHKKKLNLYKINVIAARNLSNHIADEFNISHESPQLIWLNKELKVKSHTSHYNIDETFLNDNL